MDGNLWPGQQIVMGDINVQNKNGKLFENFLTRNANLSVVNALPICEGTFTRVKTTKNKTTKTVLDFFVVCDKILPHVTKMHIDEKGEHALTKYKKGIVKTDHSMLSMELNLSFHTEKEHERFELFNLRNKVCQQKFKEFTSRTNTLSKCFESDEEVNIQFQRWQNRFNKALHACFRKVRTTNKEKKMSKIDLLMTEKKNIIKKKILSVEDKKKIDIIEKEISQACKDKEWEKLENTLGSLEANNGGTNNTNVWKELRKAYPKKVSSVPTGVKNIEGKIITNSKEKKKVILKHFFHRMRKRPVVEEVKTILNTKKETFRLKLDNARKNKSPPIDMKELEKVLKSLKVGKSRDPNNWIPDIFKDGVIGSDLKLSLLMMFNRMKDNICIPECLRTANITMLYKNKSNVELKNWRGIFVTSVLRTIFMKILHERIYETVATSMTFSQIGAQEKSVRNHLFVVNSVISDVLSTVKKSPIDLSIID